MPAQWTGKVVGELHNNGITGKMLAAELGWHEKYLSQVLNSENPPRNAEEKVNAALERIIVRNRHNLRSSDAGCKDYGA